MKNTIIKNGFSIFCLSDANFANFQKVLKILREFVAKIRAKYRLITKYALNWTCKEGARRCQRFYRKFVKKSMKMNE